MTETGAAENAKVAQLKACPLFSAFTETGLKIFASVAETKKLSKGDLLFKDGAASDALYVVADGILAVMAKDEGREVQLALLGPGEHVGSLGLLGKGSRFVSVLANGDAVLLRIGASEFNRLQGAKPVACVKLLLAIAHEVGARLAQAGEVRQAVQEAALRRLRSG